MRRLLPLLAAMLLWAAPASAQTVWYTAATDTGPDTVNPAVWDGGGCNMYGVVDGQGGSCTHPNPDEWDYSIQPSANQCASFCGMGFVYWWTGSGGRVLDTPGQAFYVTARNVASQVNTAGGVWYGFLCAQLNDTTTYQNVLWCAIPWSTSPGINGDHWDPTAWAHGGPSGAWNPYSNATSLVITPDELRSEMLRANAALGSAPGNYRPYSLNPADYSLVNLTCGFEGITSTAASATVTCTGLTAYSDVLPQPSSPAPTPSPAATPAPAPTIVHPASHPSPRHYRWFRGRYRSPFGVLNERRVVERFDRTHSTRLRRECSWLAGRIRAVADRQHNWRSYRRRWRYAQLLRRASTQSG